jgi:hypothetical protein
MALSHRAFSPSHIVHSPRKMGGGGRGNWKRATTCPPAAGCRRSAGEAKGQRSASIVRAANCETWGGGEGRRESHSENRKSCPRPAPNSPPPLSTRLRYLSATPTAVNSLSIYTTLWVPSPRRKISAQQPLLHFSHTPDKHAHNPHNTHNNKNCIT